MRLIDADAVKLPKGFFEKVDNVPKFYEWLDAQPTIDAVPVTRCKDCIFGYKYFDVINGITDSWVECRNPDGLNRDVSCDDYCPAAIKYGERVDGEL